MVALAFLTRLSARVSMPPQRPRVAAMAAVSAPRHIFNGDSAQHQHGTFKRATTTAVSHRMKDAALFVLVENTKPAALRGASCIALVSRRIFTSARRLEVLTMALMIDAHACLKATMRLTSIGSGMARYREPQ